MVADLPPRQNQGFVPFASKIREILSSPVMGRLIARNCGLIGSEAGRRALTKFVSWGQIIDDLFFNLRIGQPVVDIG
jgi:hypothetical protein